MRSRSRVVIALVSRTPSSLDLLTTSLRFTRTCLIPIRHSLRSVGTASSSVLTGFDHRRSIRPLGEAEEGEAKGDKLAPPEQTEVLLFKASGRCFDSGGEVDALRGPCLLDGLDRALGSAHVSDLQAPQPLQPSRLATAAAALATSAATAAGVVPASLLCTHSHHT